MAYRLLKHVCMRNRYLMVVLFLAMVTSTRPALAAENPAVSVIIERMLAHNQWQEAYLTQYTALRKFYADNAVSTWTRHSSSKRLINNRKTCTPKY